MAAQTWGGWTEKRWATVLNWQLKSRLLTTGHKAQWCYEKKRHLEATGEWDDLPMEIKFNLQVYAYMCHKDK